MGQSQAKQNELRCPGFQLTHFIEEKSEAWGEECRALTPMLILSSLQIIIIRRRTPSSRLGGNYPDSRPPILASFAAVCGLTCSWPLGMSDI